MPGVLLLATDFSDLSLAAVPWATRLARDFDLELHVLHVVDETSFYVVGIGVEGPVTAPTSEAMVEAAGDRMRAFCEDHLEDLVPPAVAHVTAGIPFVEIVRQARQVGAGMVVMTSHGRTGLPHVLLGSTAEGVVRNAPCSVFVVRNREVVFEAP